MPRDFVVYAPSPKGKLRVATVLDTLSDQQLLDHAVPLSDGGEQVCLGSVSHLRVPYTLAASKQEALDHAQKRSLAYIPADDLAVLRDCTTGMTMAEMLTQHAMSQALFESDRNKPDPGVGELAQLLARQGLRL